MTTPTTGNKPARRAWLPPRWIIRSAWAIHRAIYSLSGGRRGLQTATPEKQGLMRLRTVGRRSGQERAIILGYYEDGPNLVTMAMNGWGEPEPAWWLNLQARPDATIDHSCGSGGASTTARTSTPGPRAAPARPRS